MKIFPAIDIINGECVRLKKGLAENKTIYDKSPVEMAKIFQDKGFETIHVVDLDATLGKGNNDKTLELIRKNIKINIEVAGGIRDKTAIQNKINQGFDIIVIGTFAIKGIDEVSKFENNILDKISVAIDLKDNKIASHGWQQTSTKTDKTMPIGKTQYAPLPCVRPSWCSTKIKKSGNASACTLLKAKECRPSWRTSKAETLHLLPSTPWSLGS